MNFVRLLRHDVDPAPLVAAGESGDGASSGHVVEHRDVLGHPDRVCRRQHDAELADPDAPGLHREVEIEQHRVLGDLESFDMEMMLGEADGVVSEFIGQFDLLGQLPQHALVQLGTHSGHSALDLGAAADAREIE